MEGVEEEVDVLIVIVGPKCARNVAKLIMTASNVLIGLDIVKPAVQFDDICFNKEEQSSKLILKIYFQVLSM